MKLQCLKLSVICNYHAYFGCNNYINKIISITNQHYEVELELVHTFFFCSEQQLLHSRTSFYLLHFTYHLLHHSGPFFDPILFPLLPLFFPQAILCPTRLDTTLCYRMSSIQRYDCMPCLLVRPVWVSIHVLALSSVSRPFSPCDPAISRHDNHDTFNFGPISNVMVHFRSRRMTRSIALLMPLCATRNFSAAFCVRVIVSVPQTTKTRHRPQTTLLENLDLEMQRYFATQPLLTPNTDHA